MHAVYFEEPGQQVKGRDYTPFLDPCEAAPKMMYLVLDSRSRGVKKQYQTGATKLGRIPEYTTFKEKWKKIGLFRVT